MMERSFGAFAITDSNFSLAKSNLTIQLGHALTGAKSWELWIAGAKDPPKSGHVLCTEHVQPEN